MEELVDALLLRGAGEGIHLHKGHADKAGLGGQVAGKPQAAHTAAVDLQRQFFAEMILRRGSRQVPVIIQAEHLLLKGRIVGQHAYGVVVNMQAVGHGFHRQGAGAVGDEPVLPGKGQRFTEGDVHKVDPLQQHLRLLQCGALSQDPGDELKGRHIVPVLTGRMVFRIAHEIQGGHAQPLFVDRVVIQRIVPLHMGHADHCVMLPQLSGAAEQEGIPARRHRDLVPVGEFIVQCASEIKAFRPVRSCCTHSDRSFQYL